jgi:beta-galactosidase
MSGFDARSLIIDGKRELILSGAMHYPRSTPEMWPELLRESKRAGLNCIDTYVFWEAHEPQEGHYDFSGRYDLGRFLDACQKEELYVILRIGPYVCAEWNFGGLPWWLITKKGLVTRTYNRPFMKAVSQWVHELARRFGDRQHSRGGPIILVQVENEYDLVREHYGKDGPRYLEWCEREARRAGWEVPQIMCLGASRRAIATLNGFDVAKNVAKLRKDRPLQPALWTEHWPGWYDTWGRPHHRRAASAIAFEAVRFIAEGGTGINFYMWFGGTNFGRDAMYLQTASYDFDAPIDEYGTVTDKGRHLAELCSFLHGRASFLLEGRRGSRRRIGKDRRSDLVSMDLTHGSKRLEFLVNGTSSATKVRSGSTQLSLPPQGAVAIEHDDAGSRCVYRSWSVRRTRPDRWVSAGLPLSWTTVIEPLPGDPKCPRSFEPVRLPHNMLQVTRDETDYGWYQREIEVSRARKARLRLRVGDRASVWLNGVYQGTAPARLYECRMSPKAFDASFDIQLARGTNVVLVFVSSLGMIKGDWMTGHPQSTDWKGIKGAWLDGTVLGGQWSFSPGTWGEAEVGLAGPEDAGPWKPVPKKAPRLAWYRATFPLTEQALTDRAPFALLPGRLMKGMLWVNGHCVGRYWQIAAQGNIPKQDEWLIPYVTLDPPGRPTQARYHIPREWLKPGDNTLLAFEEEGGSPALSRLMRRRSARLT